MEPTKIPQILSIQNKESKDAQTSNLVLEVLEVILERARP
jgi:hypothetical protein